MSAWVLRHFLYSFSSDSVCVHNDVSPLCCKLLSPKKDT